MINGFKILTLLVLMILLLTGCTSSKKSTNVAPSITSFTATPDVITQDITGAQTTIRLDWTVTGTPTPTLNLTQDVGPDVGTVTGSGTDVNKPNATTIYTLTATNSEGTVSRNATVTVNTAPDFSLSVSDNSPSFTEGGNTDVTVTVNPTGGFSDPVTLSIPNLPAAVTASFSSNPTTSTSALNLSSNTAGTYPMTIQGVSNGTTRTADLTLTVDPPATINVNGTVTNIFGEPINNVAVKIGNKTDNTNANGEFTINNVTTPYNVIVVGTIFNTGYVFEGLNRENPTLQLIDFGPAFTKNAAVSGECIANASVAFPTPAGRRTSITYGSDDNKFSFALTSPNAPGVIPCFGGGADYALPVIWSGPATLNGALHALQWEVVGGAGTLPNEYHGYGTLNLPISDGGVFPNADINFSTGISDGQLTGVINFPPATNYTINRNQAFVDFGTNTTTRVIDDVTAPATNFTYETPTGPAGVKITMLGKACDAGTPCNAVNLQGSSVAYDTDIDPTGNTTLDLPEISRPILPANAGTGINNSTDFSWENFNNGIHVIVFNGPVNYIVVTNKSNTKIPDLSAEGLGLPAAAGYTWRIFAVNPFSNVDQATGPNGYTEDFLKAFFNLINLPIVGPENDGAFSLSVDRTFTTAP